MYCFFVLGLRLTSLCFPFTSLVFACIGVWGIISCDGTVIDDRMIYTDNIFRFIIICIEKVSCIRNSINAFVHVYSQNKEYLHV